MRVCVCVCVCVCVLVRGRAGGYTRVHGYPHLAGTPSEDEWPGVTSLPDFKSTFPKFSGARFHICLTCVCRCSVFSMMLGPSRIFILFFYLVFVCVCMRMVRVSVVYV